MMELLDAIERHIRRYLAGACTLGELHFELSAYDQAALDAAREGDTRAERLLGRVGLLIDEWHLGHRDDVQVWDGLSAAVQSREQIVSVTPQGSVQASGVTITSTSVNGSQWVPVGPIQILQSAS